MSTVKVKELSVAEFLPYGTYAGLVNPNTEKLGTAPVEFFRDMAQQTLGGAGLASFSTCRVEKREMVVDVIEYHTATAEGILPIDNDVLIHVAPATPANGCVPIDKIVVFRIPKGTMVVLRPGVWHHAPFTVNDDPANVLIVLPERTYANDCEVFELNDSEKVYIEL
ncbi:MAG: ureidoglycolate hydrolase [Gammaproteobacteria bacterium]|nr:MAG: ureidoglycolate hydrolase [Gammaproteobacteria bacterium]